MTFDFKHEYIIKFEGVFDVVEAYGVETVKMAFKHMKAEKRKRKKAGYRTPQCNMELSNDELTILNMRTNLNVYKCKISSISYVMSSLYDKLYIAIIITDRVGDRLCSKCLIIKAQYGKSKYIVSKIRDSLMKRHSHLLSNSNSSKPCGNCLQTFENNNLLRQRIEELVKLIEPEKLENFMRMKKILDLTSFETVPEKEFQKKRAMTVTQSTLETDNQVSRKISCPNASNLDYSRDDEDLFPLDEIINLKSENNWKETF